MRDRDNFFRDLLQSETSPKPPHRPIVLKQKQAQQATTSQAMVLAAMKQAQQATTSRAMALAAEKQAQQATTSLEVQTAQQGKQHFPHTGEDTFNSGVQSKRQRLESGFASKPIKNWYNEALKMTNENLYNEINNIYMCAQRRDTRPITYHLSSLEKQIAKIQSSGKDLEKQIQTLKDNITKARTVAGKMIHYHHTKASPLIKGRMDGMIGGTSPPEKRLKRMIGELGVSDLVEIRIGDFLELLKVFKLSGTAVKKIESQVRVNEVFESYSQGVLPVEDAVQKLRAIKNDAPASCRNNEMEAKNALSLF